MGCIRPITIKRDTPEERQVLCGNCPGCKKMRSDAWIFRIHQEQKQHDYSHFATFTYKEEEVIYIQDNPSLYKKHLQLFFKKLRYNVSKTDPARAKRIKYYACGEYGGKNKRPHYHAIIFDATADEITQSWQYGLTDIGTTTIKSISYVTKYMCKPKLIPEFRGDERVREFSIMSKGLGASYLTPEVIHWHKSGKRSYVVIEGRKQALPRYYKEKIFAKEEIEEINYKLLQIRKQKVQQQILYYGSPEAYYSAYKAGQYQAMLNYKKKTYERQQI